VRTHGPLRPVRAPRGVRGYDSFHAGCGGGGADWRANRTWSVAVTPPTVSGMGGPGDVVFYAITVTNQGVLTDNFSLTAESASTPP